MSIAGQVLIVTGGTSGIGEGVSRELAARGAKVVMASPQAEEGAALAAELTAAGHDALFVATDITSDSSLYRLVDATLGRHGRIDGVHCNAGVWAEGKVTDFDEATWSKVFGVNVKGTFLTLKHIVPVMERQGHGTIIITTSVAAFIGFPAHAAYCASKAALEALVRCMATDYAGVIRTVAVSPGTIQTPMLDASCAGWDKPPAEIYAEVAQKIPVRRLGTPADVAKVVAWLFSDDAGYVNGSTIFLEGGTMALPPW
ncbi:MAG: SDR family oxidoreductase [Armatimonadetes bacterium]|nr:SDR family oxidoreductase [Armatimonadota bacterium]